MTDPDSAAPAPAPAPDVGPRRGRPRGRHWRRLSRGLYLPDHLTDRPAELAAWQLVLPPGGTFTHLTAAALHGWWLPPLPDDLPVVAAIARGGSRPRRSGLRVVRHATAPVAEVLDGVRVAPAVECLVACAADLGLLDLVVLLDCALRRGSCTHEDVAAAAGHGRRGSRRLREALTLADPRAESAWEGLLRVLHLVCEVPVVAQHEVRVEGVLLGRGDLWIAGTRTLQEYDGDHHLEARQHRDDRRRDRRLTAQGWVRNGYTSADVLTRAVSVLRDADRALGREHRPERVRPWHALLQDSLFTASGTARLRTRWGLDPTSGQERPDPGPDPCRS